MRRHEEAGLARTDRLAAARHVGGDDRPAAGGRLEQRLRHALAIGRGQYRNRGAAPHLADIIDMAEPFDPRLGSERRQRRLGKRVRLSGSVGPASTSSIGRPRARSRRTAATASGTPLLRSIRATSATVTVCPGGSGSGAKWAVSTPEPRISTIRAGAMPSPASAAASSGFCTMTRPCAAARRTAQPRADQPSRATIVAGVKPEPSPFTAAIGAGRPVPRANASRAAMAPNRTGFSATRWTISGRSRR